MDTASNTTTTEKKYSIKRNSPLIRIPALLFNGVDKRKQKIPIIITSTPSEVIIKLDKEELKKD